MKKINHLLLAGLLLILNAATLNAQTTKTKATLKNTRWTAEKAQQWYSKQRWITGANFIPSTAINQLEMWQQDTFDPKTIDRELGYAEGIGFNTMRVFLHSVAYQQDPKGFKSRVGQYLTIAGKHHIQTMFVFFDDCWNPDPKAGKQPAPKIGIHNSGWVQDPGVKALKDPRELGLLQRYVKDMMSSFAHDKRILLWDLYNEPGNNKKGNASLPLLIQVFNWAHEADHDQPISVGLWKWDLEKLNTFQAQNSDVITYHDYDDSVSHKRIIQLLKTHARPLICTEYMARPHNSTFMSILPVLKSENVGAINWGLVAGKTNTMYAWDTPMPQGNEPAVWFHDIFRQDGSSYRPEETIFIKKITSGTRIELVK
jgi:hypothetical protein